MVFKRIVTEFGMDGYGTDTAEGMLCKTSEEHVVMQKKWLQLRIYSKR
jgi:hypothetical protein